MGRGWWLNEVVWVVEEEKPDRGGWVGEWREDGTEWVNELIGWIAGQRGR